MPAKLAPFAEAAAERLMRRPANPGVVFEGDDRTFGSPHDDERRWRDQILDAFGTRSESAAQAFLGQLAALFRREWNDEGRERSELELNAVLALINGARPRNELEACLLAQMAAMHIMTMRLAARALVTYDPEPGATVLAAKLARTFSMQAEALSSLRGRRSRQSIHVERHVHKHVHVTGAPAETGNQPHEPIQTLSKGDDAR